MKNLKFAIFLLIPILLLFCKPREKSAEFSPGIPVKVSQGDFNTAFSYYNTTPESPDGTKIAYTKFLANSSKERNDMVPAEIWVCNTDLTNQRKVLTINDIAVHNGARVQWLDNHSFAFQDDSIRMVNLQGKSLMNPVEGRLGHETFEGRILYSAYAEGTGLSTIYEYDVRNSKTTRLGDAKDFEKVLELFPDTSLRTGPEMWILHLQYNPDGQKIAFRLDIGPHNEKYKHLVIMNRDGSDVHYFGPKPMHFSWFDNNHIQGHDNQIEDGIPNDKCGRVWDAKRNVIETLSGPGNHFAASPNRNYIASESWYRENPVILSLYHRNEKEPFWQDTVSTDSHTTWTLANHANPSFSRDGKRVYFNKCVAPGKVYGYMVQFPE